MLTDTHIHTTFSFDSRMTLAEALAGAGAAKVALCITDHLDLDMDLEPFEPREYLEAYGPLRSKGLFLGTECGMVPEFSVKSEEIIKVTAPDFCLGSVHTIGPDDIYSPAIYEKYDRVSFWQAYFARVLECLASHPFIDSLGHLDYPARLSPYGEAGFAFKEHEASIVPVFEYLIRHEKALEFNLRRFSDATRQEFYTHFGVYRELGGRLITLGTDSHTPATIGRSLREGARLLEELDLCPVHYEHHEPVRDRLD